MSATLDQCRKADGMQVRVFRVEPYKAAVVTKDTPPGGWTYEVRRGKWVLIDGPWGRDG